MVVFLPHNHAALGALPRVLPGICLTDFSVLVLFSKTRGFKNMSFGYSTTNKKCKICQAHVFTDIHYTTWLKSFNSST